MGPNCLNETKKRKGARNNEIIIQLGARHESTPVNYRRNEINSVLITNSHICKSSSQAHVYTADFFHCKYIVMGHIQRNKKYISVKNKFNNNQCNACVIEFIVSLGMFEF